MNVNDRVLCVSSSYEEKYYFNNMYDKIPESVKEEIQIMCVMFTADVGGELILEFSEEGRLLLHVSVDEGDILFDEIGSALKIKALQNEKMELFEQLESFYKSFVKK